MTDRDPNFQYRQSDFRFKMVGKHCTNTAKTIGGDSLESSRWILKNWTTCGLGWAAPVYMTIKMKIAHRNEDNHVRYSHTVHGCLYLSATDAVTPYETTLLEEGEIMDNGFTKTQLGTTTINYARNCYNNTMVIQATPMRMVRYSSKSCTFHLYCNPSTFRHYSLAVCY